MSTPHKRDLVIYHPKSGTAIPLSDQVFLIDHFAVTKRTQDRLLDGTLSADDAYAVGRCLDNYNMGNLFFGSP